MHDIPPQLQASPQWSPESEELWMEEILCKAKLAARLLSRDGSRDPAMRATKRAICQDADFGDEINKLAKMLRDITG